MRYSEYRYLLLADLYRSCGRIEGLSFLSELLFRPRFKFMFWLRTARWSQQHPLLRYTVYPVARWLHNRYRYKYGFDIPITTEIGPGCYIGHFGTVIVSPYAVIGRNCNLSPGVVIGQSNRGTRSGAARIGDDVYIGPGAKIIGAVTIGDRAAIGANAVVTRDVAPDTVVGGVPAQVISTAGSEGYVNRTDYDQHLRSTIAET